MEEVVRKRVVGAVVLVVIGIMLPLLLSRCLHDPQPEGQDMRVYEITPTGGIEPVDDGRQAATAPSGSPAAEAPTAVETPAVPADDENAQPEIAAQDVAKPEPETEPEAEPEPEPEKAGTPEPAASAPAAQEPPDTVESTPEESVAEAPRTTTAPASSTDAGDFERDVAAGTWIVQVASFAKESNARALAQQLSAAYSVFYTAAQVNGETWYRVRIGPFDNEAAANNTAAELRAQGRDTLVTQAD